MGKIFSKINAVSSNEVSLCSKYNSGANKQTEFELVKNKEKLQDSKDIISNFLKICEETPVSFFEDKKDIAEDFIEFLNWTLENNINNAMYEALFDTLWDKLCAIKWNELSKEDKTEQFAIIFNLFIEAYQELPITKTKDNTYEVSLLSKSHIKDIDKNPQNETTNLKKEKTSKMEEQKTAIEKAIELLTSAFGLNKTNTPAEVNTEVTKTVETEEAKKPAEKEVEKTEEKPAEVEAPKDEKTENTVAEEVKSEEVKQDETNADKEVKKTKEVEKTSNQELETVLKQKMDLEKELAELKKTQEEKEIEIAKMSFVQKAKDEFAMLSGTSEQIGEKLYDISKSNLSDEAKSFIFEQFKKVAENNKELTQEIGSMTKSADDLSDEDIIYKKAEEIAKTKNISVQKALREVK